MSRTYSRNSYFERRNERNNVTYNNNRIRNNNYPESRISEPTNTRPIREYNPATSDNSVQRSRPRSREINSQYNGESNNRISPSRRFERSTQGANENGNVAPRDYEDRRPDRNVVVPNDPRAQDRLERISPWRNNNQEGNRRVMPEGYSQPQRRIVTPSQPNSPMIQQRERSYNPQASQRPSERREIIRSNSVSGGDGNNGSRPSRYSVTPRDDRGRREN